MATVIPGRAKHEPGISRFRSGPSDHPGMTVHGMAGFWRNDGGKQRSAVSADFEHALAREVLQTELIRIKALIATALLLLLALWAVDLLDPEGLNRIWRCRFRPA